MPGQTPIYQLPYPLQTDPIYQGANQVKALAERFETVLSAAEVPPVTYTPPESAQGYRQTTQSIPNATDTYVSWTHIDWDTETSAGRPAMLGATGITIRRTGVYAITASLPWAFGANGTRILRVQRNRSGALLELRRNEIPPTGLAACNDVAFQALLQVNDLIRVIAFQNNGAALNVLGSTTVPGDRAAFSATLIRPS
ncbi:hypothetical protein [Rhodococcus tibetensis]|uniref:C1q domain-containing protein n=1 Tax=Rhodococcus tibetensis TaxID=2965064 RepID=A0ABT1QDR5_9NOCA|nr:hypothetical protein [Rhodococcus sp. FXJ9.536]MCQ4120401.1 hypothetical protein [Rhodococcus sp. FXJ9.536]